MGLIASECSYPTPWFESYPNPQDLSFQAKNLAPEFRVFAFAFQSQIKYHVSDFKYRFYICLCFHPFHPLIPVSPLLFLLFAFCLILNILHILVNSLLHLLLLLLLLLLLNLLLSIPPPTAIKVPMALREPYSYNYLSLAPTAI